MSPRIAIVPPNVAGSSPKPVSEDIMTIWELGGPLLVVGGMGCY